jgi:hypothetical protein
MHPLTQAQKNLLADALAVVPLAAEAGAVLLLVGRAAKAVPVVLAMRAQTKKSRTTKTTKTTRKTGKRRKTKTRAAQEAALQTQRVVPVEPLATRRPVRVELLATRRQVRAEAPPTTTTLALRTLKDLTSRRPPCKGTCGSRLAVRGPRSQRPATTRLWSQIPFAFRDQWLRRPTTTATRRSDST